MSRPRVDEREWSLRAAIALCTVLVSACSPIRRPSDPAAALLEPAAPTGALSGTVSVAEGQSVDEATGPVVVMLAPVGSGRARNRPVQQFTLTSGSERFDPGFAVIAEGDFLVFANEGPVSHRLFSAALGSDLHIPVAPSGSSPPQRIERRGELRFFCALHPEENFSVLVTGDVFSAVVDAEGRYYIAPIPRGSYRLSIWSGQAEVPIRTLEVTGPSMMEEISLDPSWIRQ
jgi:hypothetical protein